ncbi:MAG: hypothetical protein NVS3B11_28200 [Collimonas sp.]
MLFSRQWNAEASEPYFQVASAVLIIAVAAWMMWRTWRRQQFVGHGHDHDQGHQHEETKLIDTGRGTVRLEIFEDGFPPRFPPRCRLYSDSKHGHVWRADQVRIMTERADSSTQSFTCVQRDGFVESAQEIPEPHEFVARLRLKKSALGATLVLCFSIGLALTMVLSGALAALSVKHVSRRWSGFGEFARKAPYFSGALILLVGVYVRYQGLHALI